MSSERRGSQRESPTGRDHRRGDDQARYSPLATRATTSHRHTPCRDPMPLPRRLHKTASYVQDHAHHYPAAWTESVRTQNIVVSNQPPLVQPGLLPILASRLRPHQPIHTIKDSPTPGPPTKLPPTPRVAVRITPRCHPPHRPQPIRQVDPPAVEEAVPRKPVGPRGGADELVAGGDGGRGRGGGRGGDNVGSDRVVGGGGDAAIVGGDGVARGGRGGDRRRRDLDAGGCGVVAGAAGGEGVAAVAGGRVGQ